MFITTFYLLLNQVIKLSSQEVQPGVGKRKVTIKSGLKEAKQTYTILYKSYVPINGRKFYANIDVKNMTN